MYGEQRWKKFLNRKKTQEQIDVDNKKRAEIEKLLKMKMENQLAKEMRKKMAAQFGRSAVMKLK